MIKTHATRAEARAALGADDFKIGFSSPGRPELWVKGKTRLAVARRVIDADEDWVIITYPEPTCATPVQVAELAQRDGTILANGNDPVICDPDADLL
jgi:hypothetical protein